MSKPNEEQLEEIDSFFKNYIFGWIIGNLSLVIAPREGNNLAFAILCFTHIEFLGGFLTGKSASGESTKNVVEFLKYMSQVTGIKEYGTKAFTLTECLRNGLIHNYMYGKSGAPFGVQRLFVPRSESIHLKFEPIYKKENGRNKLLGIASYVNIYYLFDDFKNTVNQFYEDVKNGKLFINFEKRLAQIREERDKGFQTIFVNKNDIKKEWPEYFNEN